MTTNIYVGTNKKTELRLPFKSAQQPTEDSHGETWKMVVGPYRTLRDAQSACVDPLPHYAPSYRAS